MIKSTGILCIFLLATSLQSVDVWVFPITWHNNEWQVLLRADQGFAYTPPIILKGQSESSIANAIIDKFNILSSSYSGNTEPPLPSLKLFNQQPMTSELIKKEAAQVKVSSQNLLVYFIPVAWTTPHFSSSSIWKSLTGTRYFYGDLSWAKDYINYGLQNFKLETVQKIFTKAFPASQISIGEKLNKVGESITLLRDQIQSIQV